MCLETLLGLDGSTIPKKDTKQNRLMPNFWTQKCPFNFG